MTPLFAREQMVHKSPRIVKRNSTTLLGFFYNWQKVNHMFITNNILIVCKEFYYVSPKVYFEKFYCFGEKQEIKPHRSMT